MSALSGLAGLLTGTDNLVVGGAVGLMPLSTGRRLALAAGFGVAELAMTLLGAALGTTLSLDAGGPALVAAGLLVLLSWLRGRDLARLAQHRAAVVVLPLALSLDNLAAGAGLASEGLGSVLLAGLLSATLAGAGMALSAPLRHRLPAHAAPLCGLLLLAAGLLELA